MEKKKIANSRLECLNTIQLLWGDALLERGETQEIRKHMPWWNAQCINFLFYN